MSKISCGVTGLVMAPPKKMVSGTIVPDTIFSRLRMLRNELPDARVDHLAVLAAAEDAVVAHAPRLEVLLVLRGNRLGEAVRGFGLAVAGDVVELALDGEERSPFDELGAHALAGDDELALGQQVLLE